METSVTKLFHALPEDFHRRFSIIVALMPKLGNFAADELDHWCRCLQLILNIVSGTPILCGDPHCNNVHTCCISTDDAIGDIARSFSKYLSRKNSKDSDASKAARLTTRQILTDTFTTIRELVDTVPDDMTRAAAVILLDIELAKMADNMYARDNCRLLNILRQPSAEESSHYLCSQISTFISKWKTIMPPHSAYTMTQCAASLAKCPA